MRTHTKKCWCGSEHDTRWNPMSDNPPPGGRWVTYLVWVPLLALVQLIAGVAAVLVWQGLVH